jgi:hypothetical protein
MERNKKREGQATREKEQFIERAYKEGLIDPDSHNYDGPDNLTEKGEKIVLEIVQSVLTEKSKQKAQYDYRSLLEKVDLMGLPKAQFFRKETDLIRHRIDGHEYAAYKNDLCRFLVYETGINYIDVLIEKKISPAVTETTVFAMVIELLSDIELLQILDKEIRTLKGTGRHPVVYESMKDFLHPKIKEADLNSVLIDAKYLIKGNILNPELKDDPKSIIRDLCFLLSKGDNIKTKDLNKRAATKFMFEYYNVRYVEKDLANYQQWIEDRLLLSSDDNLRNAINSISRNHINRLKPG